MTKRSRGVLKTRCKAIVSSTTPRFGPRCPPVWERTPISSSRTSCASWGWSCSRSALMSAGERIPSSRRAGAAVASEVRADSEELDFIICAFGFIDAFGWSGRFWCRLEILNYRFSCTVASYDFDLLLGLGKSFLAKLYEVHPLLVAHDQIFKREFAGFHLLDNLFEPIHRALKIKRCLARLRFAAHGENGGIKHSLARKKVRLASSDGTSCANGTLQRFKSAHQISIRIDPKRSRISLLLYR